MKTEIPQWIIDYKEITYPGLGTRAVEILLEIIEKLESGKPDWKDAPDWVNYRAMDYTGQWRWFEDEPEFQQPERFWRHWSGREMRVFPEFCYVDPEKSLEKRPTHEEK